MTNAELRSEAAVAHLPPDGTGAPELATALDAIWGEIQIVARNLGRNEATLASVSDIRDAALRVTELADTLPERLADALGAQLVVTLEELRVALTEIRKEMADSGAERAAMAADLAEVRSQVDDLVAQMSRSTLTRLLGPRR